MKILKTFAIILFLAILGSCEYEVIEPVKIDIPENGFSFETDIKPIITSTTCTACHTSSKDLDLTAADLYNEILPFVNTDNPSSSPLYTYPTGSNGHISLYSDTQAATILSWIEDGALDN